MEPETNQPEQQYKTLPPPWDRIFSLGMRLFVWALIATGIYILRPFFLLIFLTFVFAYIQAHGVQGLQNRIRNRPLRVTIVALVFLGTILATAFTLAPQIEDQGLKLYNRYPDLIAKADLSINQKLREYPEIWSYLEKREQDAAEAHSATQAKPTPASEPHLLKDGIQSLLGFGEQTTSNPDAMKIRTKETISKLFESVSSVLGYLSS
ncbi:MAG: AI-2E family transporter, partial [Planctomycetota bacterium]